MIQITKGNPTEEEIVIIASFLNKKKSIEKKNTKKISLWKLNGMPDKNFSNNKSMWKHS
ncbi:MAG: hypothetical protein AABZ74_03835 [Cyanobacteriota bacterium]|mgnify:CR=1 FL=1